MTINFAEKTTIISGMEFRLEDAIAVLERTPEALRALLKDLPTGWTSGNEGPDTWTPYDVVGHLIHGEKTDWIPRLKMILEFGESKPFDAFDRFAQFDESRGKTISELLETFAGLRKQNMELLRGLGVHAELLK